MGKSSKAPAGARKRRGAPVRKPAPAAVPDFSIIAPLATVAGQLKSWADTVLNVAGPLADVSMTLAKSQFKRPASRAAIAKVGTLLRQARETAGMTVRDVGKAIDLREPDLLEQAESGKVALPFEVVLRLASVLGRHDPIQFVMSLTRSYNPELWKALQDLGIGRLVVQAGREREFANIYRARDAARRLSDEEFAIAMTFISAAFDLALAFLERARRK